LRRIEWTEDAVANLDAIADYISAFNPAAAQRLAERLIAAADSLAEFSERGRDTARRSSGPMCCAIVWRRSG
jgi:plasmid stabilization system protein ParE